jgi:26S proteasome non-ATPase regulatory subunit 10
VYNVPVNSYRCPEQSVLLNLSWFCNGEHPVYLEQYSLVLTLITTDPNLVNTPDGDGRTALHWASSSGALDIVKILIDNGAVVDQRDASGWSALHIAGDFVNRGGTRFADAECKNAVSAGQEDVVRELVGAGADVSARNNLGITPL